MGCINTEGRFVPTATRVEHFDGIYFLIMRKSFIIHMDSLVVLDSLTDEQAGQLFKKIYDYNKLKEPNETQITQSVNQIIDLVFIPFKAQFDRDSAKYQAVCERNKKNGMMGGRRTQRTQSPPVAPDSKSDSKKDSDKDSDKDNDSYFQEYAETEQPIQPPRYIDQFKPQPKFKVEHIRELPKQTLWYENVIRAYKISPDDFNRLVDEFISHCHSQGKDEDKTERDLKSHFTNWLGVKQKNGELKPKPKQQYKKFNFD